MLNKQTKILIMYAFNLSILIFLTASKAHSFSKDSFALGIGYFSQNFLDEVTQSPIGNPSFLGEPNYPLLLRYDLSLSSNWFLAPQLGYTLIPRQSPGATTKVTLMHLEGLIGTNLPSGKSSWEWFFGPGIMQQEIKGNGGTTEMNNGTSTATFAVPGRTSTTRKITVNFGGSWSNQRSRLSLEFSFENAFSQSKRTQSLLLSYSYILTGGKP